MIALLLPALLTTMFGAQSNDFDDLVSKTIATGKFEDRCFKSTFMGTEVSKDLASAKEYVAGVGLVFEMVRAEWWTEEEKSAKGRKMASEVQFICTRYTHKDETRYVIVRMNMFMLANREKWRELGNEGMVETLVAAMNNGYYYHDASKFEFNNPRYWAEKVK